MHRYIKGARGERELLNKFTELGYSVIRSAGSGVNSISPDIVAVKNRKGLAFECKAWDRGSLSIEPEKYQTLVEWEKNTGFNFYIAWRMNGMGWFFIRLNELSMNEKSYSVTKKRALSINRLIKDIIEDGAEKAEVIDKERKMAAIPEGDKIGEEK